MIAKTPKLAIVTAVASACGLAFGFDLGQQLVDLYFGDDDFDFLGVDVDFCCDGADFCYFYALSGAFNPSVVFSSFP